MEGGLHNIPASIEEVINGIKKKKKESRAEGWDTSEILKGQTKKEGGYG